MLRAVIFDFNGVLIDDAAIHLRATVEVLGGAGAKLTLADYNERHFGHNDRIIARDILAELEGTEPEPARIEDLIRRKAVVYARLLEAGALPLVDGALELVAATHSAVPLAIGSGARRSEILRVLERAGVRDRFHAVVSADDVERSKPDPQVYLEARRQLEERAPGLEAGECVVIEDAVAGIEAALAAGMRCVALAGTHAPASLHRAHRVVGSLREIDLGLLRSVCAG